MILKNISITRSFIWSISLELSVP